MSDVLYIGDFWNASAKRQTMQQRILDNLYIVMYLFLSCIVTGLIGLLPDIIPIPTELCTLSRAAIVFCANLLLLDIRFLCLFVLIIQQKP